MIPNTLKKLEIMVIEGTNKNKEIQPHPLVHLNC